MKPLYLLGLERTDVELDGPALRVSQDGRADVRIPFRRLARVIVSGRVNWATNALLACADHDVPVMFLKGSGVVRARWLSTCSRRDGLFYRNWSYLIDRPDWSQEYEKWHKSAQQRVVALSAKRMGMTVYREAEELKQYLVYSVKSSVGDNLWRDINNRLDGLAEAHAVAGLADYGIQSETAEMQKLVKDFRWMTICGLFPELRKSLREKGSSFFKDDCAIASVKFFERYRSVADFNLHFSIESLCRFLEEIS